MINQGQFVSAERYKIQFCRQMPPSDVLLTANSMYKLNGIEHKYIDLSDLSECPGGTKFHTHRAVLQCSFSEVFRALPGTASLGSAIALLIRGRGALHGVGAVAQGHLG